MRLDQVILRGTFAARPAAGTLPNGSLYATTDTNEVFEVVAAAWVTFVDGDGGGGAPGGADKASQYNNAGALGGVTLNATATKKYLQQVSSGTPTFEQPAAAEISGLAASATTDTTDADNISSGTLPIGRIADAEITKAKIENVAADKLLGRGNGAGAGVTQEITLGTSLSMTGATLNAETGTNNPGGADKTIQYNDAGAFGGVAINASATKKYAQQVSSGTPTMEQVADADLVTTDVTTNNVGTTKHGFAPKAPNDATKYLDGTGAYSVPAGGGGGGAITLIETKTIAGAAVTSVSFTGLDGDADGYYELYGSVISGNNGADQIVAILFNSDSSNLYASSSGGNNAPGSSGTRGVVMQIASGNSNKFGSFKMTIFPKTGMGPRRWLANVLSTGTSQNAPSAGFNGGGYNETATNITSIQITTDQSSGIGIGSIFSLCKVTQ